jgi:hypothetical protein
MRSERIAIYVVVVCLQFPVAPIAAMAADCGPKVEAAFQKLLTSTYRSETLSAPPDGRSSLEIFEFMPPDRSRVKFGTNDKAEDDMVEFVRAGQRVWEYDKSQGWTERPELISVFDKHLERLGGPFGQFECLGPIEFSGKRYAGYRTHRLRFPVSPGQTMKGTSSWRTILVDQETGLLAWDLVTFEEQLDTLKRRTQYTYPENVAIDPPRQ